MLSNSLKRLNHTNRLIAVDDISDSVMAGRSAAHTACWKYLQSRSYDAALDYANQICKREPEKPDGYVFKARALFQLKRYLESEEVLLHVMKIADQNNLIRNDVEAVIKLKYELACARKGVLKELGVINVIDITKRYLNDFNESIVDLHKFGTKSKTQTPETPVHTVVTDNRGSSDYDQRLEAQADSEDSYHSSDEYNSCQTIPMYANGNDFEEKMLKISSKEYYRLKQSEQNCLTLEQKVMDLESELKKVYLALLETTSAKNMANKYVHQLSSELNLIKLYSNNANITQNSSQKRSAFNYKQRLGMHSYFNRNKPSFSGTYTSKSAKAVKTPPKKTVVKEEDNQQNIRTIFHNNKYIPIVE